MEQIAKKLTQYFLAHGLIKEDDTEMCQYALYRRLSRSVALIGLTLLGGLIADFGSAFCFIASFLFLRERTGGYHAKAEWKCALLSCGLALLFLLFVPYFEAGKDNYWFLMIGGSVISAALAPADSEQMHLSRAEKKAMKIRSLLRILALDLLSGVMYFGGMPRFAAGIVLGIFADAFSLMVATVISGTK